MLHAVGIPHRLARTEDGFALRVDAPYAEKARAELQAFDDERTQSRPALAPEPSGRDGLGAVLVYWYVLLAFYALERHDAFGLYWREAGRTQAHAILAGEWWRAATALCLHADMAHLLGNLVFGSLFGYLLSRQLGGGLCWLLFVLGGTTGNLLNAWIHPPTHSSIGASTGVFAVMAALMARQWPRYGRLHPSRLRRWTPAVIGAAFLGYLGTSGENTDVMAHVSGAFTGALLGLLLNLRPDFRPSRSGQILLGLAAAGVLGLAWHLALTRLVA